MNGVISRSILQNTDKVFMKQGSYDAAETAAKDLLGAIFDPRLLKQINERFTTVGDDLFLETRLDYFSPQEQLGLLIKWLMALQPGEAFVRVGNEVTLTRVPLFETQITDQQARETYRSQPCLQQPSEHKSHVKSSTGEQETTTSSSSMTSTQQEQSNTSEQESSPITRLQQEGSQG